MKAQTRVLRVNEDNYVGNIPISSIGCLYEGKPIINCPRVALLKMLGVYEEMDYVGTLTTSQGQAVESFVDKLLTRSDVEYTSEEVVKYQVGNARVSGRADFVINKELGIELKTVCSINTAKTVALGKPKDQHVIQASIYANHLNIPFLLLYWNSNRLGKFSQKLVEYKLDPFRAYFEIEWIKGRLAVAKKMTVVTKKSIEEFVIMVSESYENKVLPMKVDSYDYMGNKTFFSPCGVCSFKEICDKEETYGGFISECKLKVKGGK